MPHECVAQPCVLGLPTLTATLVVGKAGFHSCQRLSLSCTGRQKKSSEPQGNMAAQQQHHNHGYDGYGGADRSELRIVIAHNLLSFPPPSPGIQFEDVICRDVDVFVAVGCS